MAETQKQRQEKLNKEEKILNLMQFARKAGKLIGGSDACIRELHHKHIHLFVIASDTAPRTVSRIEYELGEKKSKIMILRFGTQEELSAALGLPLTAVFGISDKNFAVKMIDYWQS